MRGKAIYRWNVLDKHTGSIVGAYSTESGAAKAAIKLAERFNSPGRYIARKR